MATINVTSVRPSNVPLKQFGALQKRVSLAMAILGIVLLAVIGVDRALTLADYLFFGAFPLAVWLWSFRLQGSIDGDHLVVRTHYRTRRFQLSDASFWETPYAGAWTGGSDGHLLGLWQLDGVAGDPMRNLSLPSAMMSKRKAIETVQFLQRWTADDKEGGAAVAPGTDPHA